MKKMIDQKFLRTDEEGEARTVKINIDEMNDKRSSAEDSKGHYRRK